MGVNNPFIRYKIYSTGIEADADAPIPDSNLRVICYLYEEDQVRIPFLEKVLKAAKITPSEYQVILLQPGEIEMASGQPWWGHTDYILMFGIPGSAVGLQINLRPYAAHKIGGSQIVALPSLARIEPDKEQKQKLWNLLKKEFLNG